MLPELEKPYREAIAPSLVPRDELLAVLTDADLAWAPGGDNPAFGDLCARLGGAQHVYAESFRTFQADFDGFRPDPETAGDVARLRRWLETLDRALEAALEDLAPADAARTVAREGEQVPLAEHLLVFHEALLIFYGKAFVYLRAMGKAMPAKWGAWIR